MMVMDIHLHAKVYYRGDRKGEMYDQLFLFSQIRSKEIKQPQPKFFRERANQLVKVSSRQVYRVPTDPSTQRTGPKHKPRYSKFSILLAFGLLADRQHSLNPFK